METIEQLAAAVRRVEEQYHSPLLSLQAYARCIRVACRERRESAVSPSSSPLYPSTAETGHVLPLLVVDFLLRCNQLGLHTHAALQAAVLKINAKEDGDHVSEAVLLAFPPLQQCVARQQQQQRRRQQQQQAFGASSASASATMNNTTTATAMAAPFSVNVASSSTSSAPPTGASAAGLAVAQDMWTEAAEAVADYFRTAVDVAACVLSAQWDEAYLTNAPSTTGDQAGVISGLEKSATETAPKTALQLPDADTIVARVSVPLHLGAHVVLALLQLTLQNWSAVELSWRRGRRALEMHAASVRCGELVSQVARAQRRYHHQQRQRTRGAVPVDPLQTELSEEDTPTPVADGDDEEEEAESVAVNPLGLQVAVAQALNDCTIRAALLCEFDAVQATLRTEWIPLLSEMRAEIEEEDDDEAARSPCQDAALRLLSGLAFFTFGVAESYTASDAALLTFQEAIDQIQQWRRQQTQDQNQTLPTSSPSLSNDAAAALAGNDVQAVVDRVYDDLVTYVDTARNKRAAAAAAAAGASDKSKAGRPGRATSAQKTRVNGHAGAGGGRKGRRSLAHAAPRPLPPPPAIGAALRAYMRCGGVPMYVTSVMDTDSVRQEALANAGCAGEEEEEEEGDDTNETLLLSALSFLNVPATAPAATVVALLVCAKTPLQLAADLDEQLHINGSSISRRTRDNSGHVDAVAATRSVWSTATLVPLLQSPLPPALCALTKRDTSSGGGGGAASLRSSLPRAGGSGSFVGPSAAVGSSSSSPLFTPKPMSKKALADAQKEVSTAVRVLEQRLSTLLKAERAFEAQWSATETVKQALMAYYVPLACRAWCEETLLAQRAEQVRRDHSARVITRFVRYLATTKPHLHGAVRQRQQERERQDAAATVLQKYARRWLAKETKARLLREKQSFLHDLVVAQSLYRGRQARRWYAAARIEQAAEADDEEALLTAHFAATLIQRVYRGHATRLALLRAAGYEHVAMRLHYRDSRHYCATLIQKRVRGMLVRRVYGKAVRARCLYGRNVYRARVLEESCLTIQRWYRLHRARRQVEQQRLQAAAHREADKVARTWPLLRIAPAAAPPDESDATGDDAMTAVCRSLVLRRQLEQQKSERAAVLEARRGETYAPFDVNERVF